jgi:AcrR family transcriptional regulator
MEKMEKKEIQEQRMRGYFIEATKSLIQSEGVKSVSVRNIADQAGYSFATLYNYFKDVKVLIFECVKIFQEECEVFVVNHIGEPPAGIPRIKAITKAYVNYFMEYPGIFDLFFVEKLGSMGNPQQMGHAIYSFLNYLCDSDWNVVRNQGIYSEQQIEDMQQQLNYMSTGMLLYYMNRLQPSSYAEFQSDLERQLALTFKD